MSFADFLWQIIGASLVGLAVLVVAISFVWHYLIPKAHELTSRARANESVLRYNEAAQALVTAIVGDHLACDTLSPAIMDQVWALRGVEGRKGISR